MDGSLRNVACQCSAAFADVYSGSDPSRLNTSCLSFRVLPSLMCEEHERGLLLAQALTEVARGRSETVKFLAFAGS